MASDNRDSDEDAALRARLDRLSGALKARKATEAQSARGPAGGTDGAGSAMSMGLRAGGEFVSAIVIGAGLGWVIDRALGTSPAFMIVFFLLGMAAGVWTVIRVTSPKGGASAPISPLSRENPPDKDVRRSAPAARKDVPNGPDSGGAPGWADDDED
jgi:ATP synthase protein I